MQHVHYFYHIHLDGCHEGGLSVFVIFASCLDDCLLGGLSCVQCWLHRVKFSLERKPLPFRVSQNSQKDCIVGDPSLETLMSPGIEILRGTLCKAKIIPWKS